ncbi:MAG: M28 family peptidase, partial [Planctomycetota bacterium]
APLHLSVLLSLLLGGGTAAPEEDGNAAEAARRFERRVVAIAAGRTPEDRVAAVENELRALRLDPQRRVFEGRRRTGTNLVAVVPAAAGTEPTRTLMLGAHLDRVAAGSGAVDNAGGCAATLELLGRFQARPLRHHRVVGLWFDLEEQGLLGSRAFAETVAEPDARSDRTPISTPGAASRLPDLFVNFDVFAYGDTLWVHHPTDADESAAKALVAGTKPNAGGEAFGAIVGSVYPPSDHESFEAVRRGAEPGSPAATMTVLSLSLLPKEQIEETVAFLDAMQNGGRPGRAGLPRILALIHTPNDTPSAVRPAEAIAGVDAVEAGLRALDAAAGEAGPGASED